MHALLKSVRILQDKPMTMTEKETHVKLVTALSDDVAAAE